MNFFRFLLLLVAIIFAVSACKTGGETTKQTSEKTAGSDTSKGKTDKTDKTKGEKSESKEVKWSNKKGETGPENWAELEIANNACGGKVQSPIDIVTKKTQRTVKVSRRSNLPTVNPMQILLTTATRYNSTQLAITK